MAPEPLSRIPKNRKKKMTENEMMEKFLNENTDILLKYMLWKEHIMEPQVLNPDVKIDAVDVDVTVNHKGNYGFSNYGEVMYGTSGTSTLNHGVIEQSPEDPTRV
jgi:hypothetical protein